MPFSVKLAIYSCNLSIRISELNIIFGLWLQILSMIENSKLLRFSERLMWTFGFGKIIQMFCLTPYSFNINFETIHLFHGSSLKLIWQFKVRIYQEETLELNGYLVWSWLEGEILEKNHSNHDYFEWWFQSNHNHLKSPKITIPNQMIADHQYPALTSFALDNRPTACNM